MSNTKVEFKVQNYQILKTIQAIIIILHNPPEQNFSKKFSNNAKVKKIFEHLQIPENKIFANMVSCQNGFGGAILRLHAFQYLRIDTSGQQNLLKLNAFQTKIQIQDTNMDLKSSSKLII